MSQTLQIILGLVSGVLYFGVLQWAFVPPKKRETVELFQPFDVIFGLMLSGLFAWLAFGLFTTEEKPFTVDAIWASLAMQGIIGAAVIGYVVMRHVSVQLFIGVTFLSWWKYMLIGIVLLLGISPFIMVLANLHSDPGGEQEAVKFFRGSASLQSRLLLAFMAVIVAPVVEEMVFRGLLYRIFRGYFGKISAMFFTSVLFAAIHGNLPMFLPLTLLACALAAGVEATGSLMVSIAMHATFNGLSIGLMLLETPR